MHAQQRDSARLQSDSKSEVRRLRKALGQTIASTEALREKWSWNSKPSSAPRTRSTNIAQERFLLSEFEVFRC
jgi:hypothetical protein